MTAEPGFTFVGCSPERANRGTRSRWEASWTYANAAGRVIGGYREVLPLSSFDTAKEDAEAWAVANISPEWGRVNLRGR